VASSRAISGKTYFATLHDLPSGTILRIGDALIRLTFHCEPCKPVLKYVLLKDILHKRGVLGQFLNSGQMRIGDRLLITSACAEGIPYDIKKRIRWYMARQLKPVTASKLIFDLGLHSSYARALPAILRKMPDLDRTAVIFKARERVKAPT
jgi:MOSC domain-containing protein YiiM